MSVDKVKAWAQCAKKMRYKMESARTVRAEELSRAFCITYYLAYSAYLRGLIEYDYCHGCASVAGGIDKAIEAWKEVMKGD